MGGGSQIASNTTTGPRCCCSPCSGGLGQDFCSHVWMEPPGILANTQISLIKKKPSQQQPNPKCNQETFPLSFVFFSLSAKRHKSNLATLPGLVCRVGVGEFGEISGVGGMGRNMALTLLFGASESQFGFCPLPADRAGRGGSCHCPHVTVTLPWQPLGPCSSVLGAGAPQCHDPGDILGTGMWLCTTTLSPAVPQCQGSPPKMFVCQGEQHPGVGGAQNPLQIWLCWRGGRRSREALGS